jgi:hypothetical protein
VLICLTQIEEWEEILTRPNGVCVHALRTKASAIRASDAARVAGERMRRLERRKRAAARRAVGDDQSPLE